MVSDQEPRYRLVDDEGNIVGSLYGKADGSIAIQETDSGSDREVALAPDGTFSAPSVETESVNTEFLGTNQGTVWDQSENDFIDWWTVSPVENISKTTSSTFTNVALGNGLVADFEQKPNAATLYGRLYALLSSDSSTEQADLRPQCFDFDASESIDLDELTVSVTADASEIVDSGWTEITSASSGNLSFRRYQARVEEGGEFNPFSSVVPTLAFGWRLD